MSGSPVILIIIGLFAIAFYMLPAIIAINRGTDNMGWVIFLNVILGWTLIIWIVLLVVALTGTRRR